MEKPNRIYTENEIGFAAFFFGPIAGAYFIARNFKVFEQPQRALRTMISSVVFTALLFVALFTIPGAERLPHYILPLIFGLVANYLVQRYQGTAIGEHLDSGGAAFCWGRTVLVSLGIGVLTVAVPVAVFVAYSFATDNTASKTYGKMQHDISFDKSNISEAEIDKIASELTAATFFDDEKKKSVDVKKSGNTYEVLIYCNESIRTDTHAVQWFVDLRNVMQNAFPENPLVFYLVIGTPDNVVKKVDSSDESTPRKRRSPWVL